MTEVQTETTPNPERRDDREESGHRLQQVRVPVLVVEDDPANRELLIELLLLRPPVQRVRGDPEDGQADRGEDHEGDHESGAEGHGVYQAATVVPPILPHVRRARWYRALHATAMVRRAGRATIG